MDDPADDGRVVLDNGAEHHHARRNIYQESELQREGTCKDFLQVRKEGSRNVRRPVNFYNLDMSLSVGYRVNCTGAAYRAV